MICFVDGLDGEDEEWLESKLEPIADQLQIGDPIILHLDQARIDYWNKNEAVKVAGGKLYYKVVKVKFELFSERDHMQRDILIERQFVPPHLYKPKRGDRNGGNSKM
jgi:hypothetical protein